MLSTASLRRGIGAYILIPAIFIAVKGGEQLEYIFTVEQMSTHGLDRQWTIIQLLKGNSDSCYSTDEP